MYQKVSDYIVNTLRQYSIMKILTPFCYRYQLYLLYYVFIVFNVECHLLMKLLTNTNALHHLLTQLLTNTNSPHTISWYNK